MGQTHCRPTLRPLHDIEEEEVDPHEFLCVSVTPGDDQVSLLPSPTEEKYPVQYFKNTLRFVIIFIIE